MLVVHISVNWFTNGIGYWTSHVNSGFPTEYRLILLLTAKCNGREFFNGIIKYIKWGEGKKEEKSITVFYLRMLEHRYRRKNMDIRWNFISMQILFAFVNHEIWRISSNVFHTKYNSCKNWLFFLSNFLKFCLLVLFINLDLSYNGKSSCLEMLNLVSKLSSTFMIKM